MQAMDFEGDGEWGDLQDWPIIPLHMLVLPDGKVLSFGTDERGMQGANFIYDVYDPETGRHHTLPNTTETDIFCAHMALDPATGLVMIFGGDARKSGPGGANDGVNSLIVFDPRTLELTPASETMEYARWYPTVLTLANGEILALGGRNAVKDGSSIPEIWSPTSGFRSLTGAEIQDFEGDTNDAGNLNEAWWYPHAFQRSSGEIVVLEAFGRDVYIMTTQGTGTVSQVTTLPFASHKMDPSVMYDVDKVLMVDIDGGIWSVDLSPSVPTFAQVGQMPDGRTAGNMSILADGSVLITGGTDYDSEFIGQGSFEDDVDSAQLTAIRFNPQTGETLVLAAEDLARLYHSAAVVLEDGTVISGGGGAPGPLTNLNAQIFSPDIYYNDTGNLADQPVITSIDQVIQSGTQITITVDDTSDIARIGALRVGAVTHSTNSDARYVPLTFSVIDSTTITVTIPNANIMIPGHWMMALVDDEGVPSAFSSIGVDVAANFFDDYEPLPERVIYVSNPEVVEGATVRQAVFDVRISEAFETATSFTFTTVDGTAVAGLDYVAQTGTIIFQPGAIRASVTIDLMRDTLSESTEAFSLLVTPVDEGIGLSAVSGTGMIVNNDRNQILGTEGIDLLAGTQGADIIETLGGGDRVSTGDGDDQLYLGDGDDYVRVGRGSNYLDGGDGIDYISYYDSVGGVTISLSSYFTAGGLAADDRLVNFENASGSRVGDDVIYGSNAVNVIRTYGGNDSVYAGGGADEVHLGDGNDFVRVGGGQETFHGGAGWDYISYFNSGGGVTVNLTTNIVSGGWVGNDTISGFEGITGSATGGDRIHGTSGANTIRTFGGNDSVYAGSGNDRVILGDGEDFVRVGGGGAESFFGGEGRDYISYYDSTNGVTLNLHTDMISRSWASNDTISGFEGASGSNTGADVLLGTFGKNTLRGFGGNDRLYGRQGDDVLEGGKGLDRLDGGPGTDQLSGGADADTFHFDRGEDHDVIVDFQDDIDTIELDNFAFAPGSDAFDFATAIEGDVVFEFGDGDRLTVRNTTIAELLDDMVIL
ncbi:galactose oxidase-like domain-containing protein [Shimia sp. MIT910701]|uniref:galactose oxidase-like domain-containing protein n=1 Tax=Shimia sp. MIT910701 TaxID=3096987 RepID=UPI00399AEA84